MEKRWIVVQEPTSPSGGDTFQEFHGSLDAANAAAKDAWRYLTAREKEKWCVYVGWITADMLEDPDDWATWDGINCDDSCFDSARIMTPRQISLDNGLSFYDSAHDAMAGIEDPDCGITWDVVTSYMDPETMEAVSNELAPCDNVDFLARYLDLAPEDLIIG